MESICVSKRIVDMWHVSQQTRNEVAYSQYLPTFLHSGSSKWNTCSLIPCWLNCILQHAKRTSDFPPYRVTSANCLLQILAWRKTQGSPVWMLQIAHRQSIFYLGELTSTHSGTELLLPYIGCQPVQVQVCRLWICKWHLIIMTQTLPTKLLK